MRVGGHARLVDRVFLACYRGLALEQLLGLAGTTCSAARDPLSGTLLIHSVILWLCMCMYHWAHLHYKARALPSVCGQALANPPCSSFQRYIS